MAFIIIHTGNKRNNVIPRAYIYVKYWRGLFDHLEKVKNSTYIKMHRIENIKMNMECMILRYGNLMIISCRKARLRLYLSLLLCLRLKI